MHVLGRILQTTKAKDQTENRNRKPSPESKNVTSSKNNLARVAEDFVGPFGVLLCRCAGITYRRQVRVWTNLLDAWKKCRFLVDFIDVSHLSDAGQSIAMDSPEREAKMDNLELPKKKSWDGAIAMTRQLVSGIVEKLAKYRAVQDCGLDAVGNMLDEDGDGDVGQPVSGERVDVDAGYSDHAVE